MTTVLNDANELTKTESIVDPLDLVDLSWIHGDKCQCPTCTANLVEVDESGAVVNSLGAYKPLYTTDQIIAELLISNRSWTSGSVVSFGINTPSPTNVAGYTPSESSGLIAMTSAQIAAARLSFRLWDDLIPITFLESGGASAKITFNYSSNTGSSTYSQSFTSGTSLTADQIWLASTWTTNADSGVVLGGYGLITMEHEIGHAIGLHHSGNYNGTATYSTDALFAQDSRRNTIMSYFDGYSTTSNMWATGTSSSYLYPQTPMVYDIVAIQSLYGLDTTTRGTNTVYGYNCNLSGSDTERQIYDFSTNATPIFTIWDAAGVDTLDASGWAGSQVIDLTPGSYSSVRGLNENVAIAFSATIEDGIGGSGSDALRGNGVANKLTGNAGADYIDGGAGSDVLIGGSGTDTLNGGVGNDIYSFSLGDGLDVIAQYDNGAGKTDAISFGAGITAGMLSYSRTSTNFIINVGATDKITIASYFKGSAFQVESIVFSDSSTVSLSSIAAGLAMSGVSGTESADTLSGSESGDTLNGLGGNDSLLGNGGDDWLDGGSGQDSLWGSIGADVLIGNTGNDYLVGSVGNDEYWFDLGDGQDVIVDNDAAVGNVDKIRLGAGITQSMVVLSRSVSDLTLTINASESIVISGYYFQSNSYRVEQVVFSDGATWDLTTLALPLEVDGLNVTGTAGNNLLSGSGDKDTLTGLDGNDTLNGFGGSDYLDGGNGNDIIIGGDGGDTLLGGAGIDFLDGGAGNDFLDGGADIDMASYASATSAVVVSLAAVGWQDTGGAGFDSLLNIEQLEGSAFNDTLTGGSGSCTLSGGVGADSLEGGGGDDSLIGGADNDTMRGGAGNDTMDGGSGKDQANYRDASSAVTVSLAITTSQNTLGAGWDTLLNIEQLVGSAYNDKLTGDSGDNYFEGRLGNDTIDGGAGSDTISYITASAAVNVNFATGIATGDGTDTLINLEKVAGSAFGDTLTGNGQANTFEGRGGNDTIDGGAGIDTILYSNATAAMVVNLATGVATGDGVDTLINIENLTGSKFNDVLTGNSGDNWIQGGTGDDTINGGAGNDTLDGGAGNDTYLFTAGAGVDRINDYDALPGNTDVVSFSNIVSTAASVVRSGNDLVINYGVSDHLTVGDYFNQDQGYKIEQFKFSNGVIWNAETVNALINGNRPPVAIADQANAVEDLPLVVAAVSGVLANDTDVDVGDTKVVTGVSYGLTGGSVGTALAGNYGTLTLNNDGSYTYLADKMAAESLGVGQTATESFNYAMRDGSGATSSTTLTFNINGVNDIATIVGLTSASVTEDTDVTNDYINVMGSLGVIDVDSGQSMFATPATLLGTYGNFTFNTTTGAWGYSVRNSQSAIQQLGAGQSLTDSLLVTSVDGSASQYIVATIDGTNDIASLSGTYTGAVVEAGGDNNGIAAIPNASGVLSISDVDAAQASYLSVPAASLVGTYGNFSFNTTNGAWTYAIDNTKTATQALIGGAVVHDILSVTSLDGSASQQIDVTVTGSNDTSVISGTSTGAVTEDWALVSGSLTANGTLNVMDVDSGQTMFATPETLLGSYGSFTFNNTNGAWSYAADNSQIAIQQLGAGQSLNDSIAVTSVDGSASQNIVVTIAGANDVATIAGSSSASVTEDVALVGGNLTASGTLSVTDVDIGQALFATPATLQGWYGNFTFDTVTGAWSYTADNTQFYIQQLGAGQSLSDSIVVTSADGSASQNIVVSIIGTNDIATIVGNSSASLTEDIALVGGNLVASGDLTVGDIDSGQSMFATPPTLLGTYGSFTFNTANGEWSYAANNAQSAIQQLGAGQSLTDSLVVSSLDGSASQTVAVTVNGRNKVFIGTADADLLIGTGGNDTVDGGASADTMIGGAGDDLYVVDNVGDLVVENAGEGTDTVKSSVSFGVGALGANIENLTLLDGAINGLGNALDNVIVGNGANNLLDGQLGNDLLDGGVGDDSLFGGAGNDTMLGGVGNDYIYAGWGDSSSRSILDGGDGDDSLFSAGSNTMIGGAGNDFLSASNGVNLMMGGQGNDVYAIDNSGDVVVEYANEGTDAVFSTVDFTLGANLENLYLWGTATVGVGNDLNNVIQGTDSTNSLDGGSGDDTLDGSYGADTMIGGAGNDLFIVDNLGDIVLEGVAAGVDTVESSVTYTLSANVENLTLTDTAAIDAWGNELNNLLIGNTADNTLLGFGGADTMIGGLGNDTYWVDNAGDVVVENAGEGTDRVNSTVNYTLGSNVENLSLFGSAVVATGNVLGNIIGGNDLDNLIDGGAGADTLGGDGGNDTYIVDNVLDIVFENASEGTDLVKSSVTYTLYANVENLTLTGSATINGTGNTLANLITGNAAANTLDGGSGADTLVGGAGNDIYIVDNAADVVTENASEGTDLVKSSVTYTLATNVENLTLTGSMAINGTGNTLDNVLSGNSAVNTLTGGSGNDTLDGGAGADILIGGAGNDTYVVDNTGDVVTENPSEGTDLVMASVSYTLGNSVENLTLTGVSAINGTGNGLNNIVMGNVAANTLDGGSGADSLLGGAGDDIYSVDNVGDVVTENAGEGMDIIKSSVTYSLGNNVENLTLTGTAVINGTGNALDNVLTGNSAANKLTGAAGNDTLDGGAGADSLIGGVGNDTYIVDNTGDVITENASEGTDLVKSSVTWTLGNNLENLTLTGTAAINGTGNTLNNVLTGNGAANTLTGLAGNDTLDGGAGNDSLVGGTGNDTYLLGRGYGTDTITESDATSGNTDVLKAASDVVASQLWFRKSGNNLEVSIIGTSDKDVIANWYLGNQYHVEQFKSGDGKTLLDSQVANLVSAMAAFAPPGAGQTTLPANYQSSLNTVIAANWK